MNHTIIFTLLLIVLLVLVGIAAFFACILRRPVRVEAVSEVPPTQPPPSLARSPRLPPPLPGAAVSGAEGAKATSSQSEPIPPPLRPVIGSVPEDSSAGWLRRHFRRHAQRRPGAFLWRVTLEGFLVTTMVAIAASLLGIEERDFKAAEFPAFAFSAILVAPLLETLLLQMLPVGAARLCGASRQGQMTASIVLFALPHFLVAIGTGLAAGLIGGFYFAFSYTHWRRQSLAQAYWMTAAQHAIHNTGAMAILGVALLAS
jgi:hypothetical protein